ncbi:MAG: NAD(P)/FAD-dependent oxidoreductase [Nocardioidaceae bacterium]
MGKPRIAVVGSGVAGLTAAYVLQGAAEVTLYEAQGRLGGHAHTHELADAGGRTSNVDSGFIVYNEATYPHLTRLFGELGVDTQPTEMSMSVRCDGCGLEYAGARGLRGLFPSARNAIRGRFLRLLAEVPRFHRQARSMLADPTQSDSTVTIEQFLTAGRFSRYFRSHFVTPLVSAVWSCPPEDADRYPARYLFAFLHNHGMLSVTGSPAWRTVTGGSARYVATLGKQLTAVHTSTPVRMVTRRTDGVDVRDDADQPATFDAAVIATHPDHALALLAGPTANESATLGAFRYSTNPTVLHTETGVLPHSTRAQAAWNYLLPDCTATTAAVHVSYDMSRLQRLDSDTRYLVTLNEGGLVPPHAILERMVYEHPVYTPESVAAQADLPRLNDGRVAFAGAYHGWGFHEDGCRSGVAAARSLGGVW